MAKDICHDFFRSHTVQHITINASKWSSKVKIKHLNVNKLYKFKLGFAFFQMVLLKIVSSEKEV